jgi:hypothetical protein
MMRPRCRIIKGTLHQLHLHGHHHHSSWVKSVNFRVCGTYMQRANFSEAKWDWETHLAIVFTGVGLVSTFEHTSLVLVLGTFWNLHTSLILDLGPRIETHTRPLLLQGACLTGCYWCKVDIASGHTSLVGSYLIPGTGLSVYETNIGPFLCWVWPIPWILRAPIPKVEAPHHTLLGLWWSSLKLPPLDGEWGEYLLLTQPDLILRPSLWEVGLTGGSTSQ